MESTDSIDIHIHVCVIGEQEGVSQPGQHMFREIYNEGHFTGRCFFHKLLHDVDWELQIMTGSIS